MGRNGFKSILTPNTVFYTSYFSNFKQSCSKTLSSYMYINLLLPVAHAAGRIGFIYSKITAVATEHMSDDVMMRAIIINIVKVNQPLAFG